MTIEKTLEYLMLDKVLFNFEGEHTDTYKDLEVDAPICLDNMCDRYFKLEDEFINKYKLPLQ